MDFMCMDPQTVKMAVQLEDIADQLNGFYDDGMPTQGEERANLLTIQRDLQHQLTVLEGQVSVLNILQDDYNELLAFKKLIDDEKQAVSDHQLAMSLDGVHIEAADGNFSAGYGAQLDCVDDLDLDTQLDMAKQLYSSVFDDNEEYTSPTV